MAGLAGVELLRRHADRAHLRGVEVARLINFDDGASELGAEPLQSGRQEGGLACPGTGDEARGKGVGSGETLAVAAGDGFVLGR
jgi:hypothetical protein